MNRKAPELIDLNKSALVAAAKTARTNAYCEYSNFPVGAAVRTADGSVFVGCNIENASYGLTMCAERVAIFHAVSAGKRSISAVAVSCLSTKQTGKQSLMPCGACLQVMAEFSSEDLLVIVDGVGTFQLKDLLPQPFHLSK